MTKQVTVEKTDRGVSVDGVEILATEYATQADKMAYVSDVTGLSINSRAVCKADDILWGMCEQYHTVTELLGDAGPVLKATKEAA